MKNISTQFPIWFCDIWGVVHDGYKPFEKTCAALAKHRARGGIVILVSNSPRTAEGVALQLSEIGVPKNSYDDIVTSGDVTRTLMVAKGGSAIFHIGPKRDSSIFAGLNMAQVALPQATSVLCTGLFDEINEKPADYLPLLGDILKRGIPFISANPDKIVRKGKELIYCAGAIAEEFGQLGGTVLMAGKPFAPIYDLAVAKAEKWAGRPVAKSEVLAIGDGPETDIKGAADYGLACVLITGGINSGKDVLQQVSQAVPHANIINAMTELDWI